MLLSSASMRGAGRTLKRVGARRMPSGASGASMAQLAQLVFTLGYRENPARRLLSTCLRGLTQCYNSLSAAAGTLPTYTSCISPTLLLLLLWWQYWLKCAQLFHNAMIKASNSALNSWTHTYNRFATCMALLQGIGAGQLRLSVRASTWKSDRGRAPFSN